MGIVLKLLMLLLVGFLLLCVLLYFRQDSMIYHPRPYRDDHLAMVPSRAVKLKYDISCGEQTVWYVPPRSAGDSHAVPPRIWILFGGNGSLAMFWSEIVAESPDADAGYVFFEYPGYGYCEGKPSPATMEESGDAMLTALAKYLGVSPEELAEKKLRLMGHSLGTGVALAFAARNPVDRVVLIAPFTTFRAMADRVVSPWFSWLLRHDINNMRALEDLANDKMPPRVIVTHGDQDGIVPVEMGREMEQRWPGLIDYIEVPGANHESILDGAENYMAVDLPVPL